MSVNEFICLATDLSGVNVRMFDFNKEKIVFNMYTNGLNDLAFEIESVGIGEYEILNYELYKTENENVYLDLYIETEDNYE